MQMVLDRDHEKKREIGIMERNEIVSIYIKRLNKNWECSYGAFLNNWSKNAWVIVDNSKQK